MLTTLFSCFRFREKTSNKIDNVGNEPASELMVENAKTLEKLKIEVTEEIKKDNKQNLEEITDRLQSMEASISKLLQLNETAQKSKDDSKKEPINEYTEQIRHRHEQRFNALSDKLQSIEASIQKSKDVSEKDPIDQSIVPINNTTNVASKTVKRFRLKHVFKDAANLMMDQLNYSEYENHYNVKWCVSVKRSNGHLGFYIHCELIDPADKWSIRTKLKYKVVNRLQSEIIRTLDYCYENSEGRGCPSFLEWEEMKNWCLVGGNLTVEAEVTIIETTGLGKKKIRKFDESQKDVSDVILVVGDTKFHVSKMFLASQSSVFKALLLGNFSESKQSEVALNGIDPDDFHYFLEVLYGESAVNDFNVEGVALLSDMYDAPTAMRRCEDFLLKESKMPLEEKLEMAIRYNLERLKAV
ncbi:hypothetical protein B9Z55_007705 [Caenorhabditis nigoni]|uniref:BTB domain-containing protein n=1 Tax=Caenorhabditis nigoni TaxID=1611254 RepID=A0A2G5VBI3_9PELO|nr:hypothetical protein B9Z55_007705 [Caenorhabditis nigoni]